MESVYFQQVYSKLFVNEEVDDGDGEEDGEVFEVDNILVICQGLPQID